MVIWLDPQSDIIDFIRDVIDFFAIFKIYLILYFMPYDNLQSKDIF